MRNFIAAAVATVIVLAFSLQPATSAQSTALTPAPSGADLDAKAKAFLSAVKSHSAENVMQQLAPWRQSEAELYRARIIKAGRGGTAQWESIERQLKNLDPQNKLNVGSMHDYLALNAAQMFGLAFGLYRAAANADAARLLADEWFVVDRKIGLCEPSERLDRDEGRRGVMETGGRVALESVDGGKLFVFCVTDGREWFVVDAGFKGIGSDRMNVRMAMAGLSGDMSKGRAPGFEARAAEGEQMLGSMKNRAKVAYAKTTQIPGKLTGNIGDGGCGVQEAELDGKYYKSRDAIYTSDTMYALVGEPKDESDPWLLFMGDIKVPQMDLIRHYDTKAEVDAATEMIKKGEIPPAKNEKEDGPRGK